MKIVLWLGNEPNQKALASKMAVQFDVVGIVTETRKQQRKITVQKIKHSIIERLFLSSINKAWWGLQNYYQKYYSNFPEIARLDIENINSNEAEQFTRNLKPDLIIVSGTRLIKKEMLSIPVKHGILNLHTGLSPYIKSGPNCTNWCIATKQFHLVGNTIMWIDEGIDSGNIVTTEQTDIDWEQSLLDIHINVMEHAHNLYLKAVNFIQVGGRSNVAQKEIGEGKTNYTKEWGLKQKIQLLKNLKQVRKMNKENITEKKK
ncbi:formyltransferase family protein [Brumimicrobium aurantiacum]|uniref:phosphoribosylglycinamide formyltransferase 1 n=1 Tax=Brumimicrobium aurantiacum TaxID=1737063 RepID=A0A3E1F1V8_9FLAO|nr:formyltransferase family protein [Brumimicrobium aurantiacum]RFC55733.1 hypothetical protein DXU93_02005 [Brumimicrobium aurantiacum]